MFGSLATPAATSVVMFPPRFSSFEENGTANFSQLAIERI
jgi:hypothetical protein